MVLSNPALILMDIELVRGHYTTTKESKNEKKNRRETHRETLLPLQHSTNYLFIWLPTHKTSVTIIGSLNTRKNKT